MKRGHLIALLAALAALIALAVIRPNIMVSPGKLTPAHAALRDDCFACHAPFRGASSSRCLSCHKPEEIGIRTTKGVPVPRKLSSAPFHQALKAPDCLACHREHDVPGLARGPDKNFDHGMLKADLRARCQSCHTPPRDAMHRPPVQACATCHQPPRWKPATFDHSRFFDLDRNHRVTCVTCHPGNNYRRYTCYGCHEHQPAQILAEHREEGIRNVDNCVRCHRSADAEADEGGEREEDDD